MAPPLPLHHSTSKISSTMDNNKHFQFKTNINCSGCVATVTPYLDNADGVCHWSVNTDDRNKVLTVESEGITPEQIMKTVQKAGFKIEPLNN